MGVVFSFSTVFIIIKFFLHIFFIVIVFRSFKLLKNQQAIQSTPYYPHQYYVEPVIHQPTCPQQQYLDAQAAYASQAANAIQEIQPSLDNQQENQVDLEVQPISSDQQSQEKQV